MKKNVIYPPGVYFIVAKKIGFWPFSKTIYALQSAQKESTTSICKEGEIDMPFVPKGQISGF
ncbi:MAG: hypothetical protein WC603_02785 [Candidatus Paceibacterota bacterium]|jgi:hypothetical protein